jgi:ABC-type dipeptide/oligopeptide/nickel transport system ATPase component
MDTVLQIEDLKTYFHSYLGLVKAVDGVSLHVDQQEIIGLVGESGCGKTVTMLSVMQLVPVPPAEIAASKVLLRGEDLLGNNIKGDKMCSIRGSKIAMIFQEPMTSLNPVLTIRRQLCEMMELHLAMTPQMARKRAIERSRWWGYRTPRTALMTTRINSAAACASG